MDAIMKLAEVIEQKYREKYICKNDIGYLKQDWLIHQVVKILKKYPKLLELITPDMSIEKIMGIINDFIANEIERRQLKLEKLRFILTDKWQCRSQETMLLLLLLGYCFHKSVIRMKNNNIAFGEYFKPYEAECVISHMAYPMPYQSANNLLDLIIKQLTESSCSASDIQNNVDNLAKTTSSKKINEIIFVNKNNKHK